MLLVMLVKGLGVSELEEELVRKVERATSPMIEMMMFTIVHPAEKETSKQCKWKKI